MQVAIIGAGAWGTTLALVARRAGHDATLWAFEPDVAAAINQRHTNGAYLPAIDLDPAIRATSDLREAVAAADAVLLVTPAQHARAITAGFAPALKPGVPVVICSKGIEEATGALLSDSIAPVLSGHPIAVLSGPTFAREVAMGLPTAVTIACTDHAAAHDLARELNSGHFRLYSSGDVIGVQVGGAVKNVIAIAAGVSRGLELGENARAALVTRGLAEIARLNTALGGKMETLLGLSGLGDLMLTTGSEQSRNTTLGVELARGRSAADILAARTSIAEGAYTAAAVDALATKLGVEMPISSAVNRVLKGELTPAEAITMLLERPVRAETG
jgi:glycerol-3-phosphate dehydrogenase (NAD(P)+)